MSLIRKWGRGFVLPYKNIRKHILELIPDKSSVNSILDFGSGTLFWSEWFKDAFNCKVTGYDPLYKKKPVLNNKNIETVYELNNAIQFDTAFICDVLHHMKQGEITKTLQMFTEKAKYIIIKDIEAEDFLGNLQNRLHDLIINRTKTTDIYSAEIIDFLQKQGFSIQKYDMKKLGYPHFLICAKRQT